MAKKQSKIPDVIKVVRSGKFQFTENGKTYSRNFAKEEKLKVNAKLGEPFKGNEISPGMAKNLLTFKLGVKYDG